jgi:hypothetical protein
LLGGRRTRSNVGTGFVGRRHALESLADNQVVAFRTE